MKVGKMVLIKSLATVFLLLLTVSRANADWTIEREHTERWDGGGTTPSVIRGTETAINDVIVNDINSDGIEEIITIGTKYIDEQEAELRISTWNGESYTVLAEQTWATDGEMTSGRAVYSGDVDGDGAVEIITLSTNGLWDTGWLELKAWRWDAVGATLSEVTNRRWENSYGTSLDAGDVDGDGIVEIVVGGDRHAYAAGAELHLPNFKIVRLEEGSFVEELSMDLDTDRSGRSVLVAIGDVSPQPGLEIVTVSKNSFMSYPNKLGVWRWDGEAPAFLGETEVEDSNFEDLVLANFDSDEMLEVVTVGYQGRERDPAHKEGVVSIWDYGDSGPLELMTRHTWTDEAGSDMYFHCVDIGNVMEGAGRKILVGGHSHSPSSSQKVMVIFGFDRMAWEVDNSHQWNDEYGGKVYEITAADVDGDETVEIVTVGNSHSPVGDVWSNFETIIWHLRFDLVRPTVEEPPRRIYWPPGAFVDTLPIAWRYVVYTAASIIAVISVVIAVRVIFFVFRKFFGRDERPM